MADYIPPADAEFNSWQTNFVDYASANMVALGLGLADLAPITAAQSEWETAFPAHVTAVASAESARAEKDASRAGYVTLVRALVRRLQASPLVNDAERAALGITVPGSDPQPSGPPTTAPIASIECSGRLRHKVNFVDEMTPTRRAKPLGVLGAEIWGKVGSPAPTDPSQLNFLGLCTRTPFVANYDGAAGGQMAYYWVRWVNHTGEKGPWGDPVNATINA
ncbi:MAG TPA: hypothetical protein VNT79_18200 [Phycisphaerae bacterium]|nr:hypothetical protein [Phycisphaerae bacterium]